jgi:hypothetical protein
MRTGPRHTARAGIGLAALVGVALVGGAGCSSSDSAPPVTTTPTFLSTNANGANQQAVFDKSVQAALITVGCYGGPSDGIIGPATDAAILAFQSASELKPDGQLGPETNAALKDAAAAGKKVCKAAAVPTTTAPTGGPTTTAAAAAQAPCTATAIAAGLGVASHAVTITSYVCANGYAAGTQQAQPPGFILQSQGGAWVPVTPSPCGAASAGLPPIVLATGCPPGT